MKLIKFFVIILLAAIAFGQEVKVACPPPPPPPPPQPPDCAISLAYFDGQILAYLDAETNRTRYYAYIQWGIDGRGTKDGEWELLKVFYKIDKDTGAIKDAWIDEFKALKTPYFDGRITDHFFEDYHISKSTEVAYILRWKCGPCGTWRYFGPLVLTVPK